MCAVICTVMDFTRKFILKQNLVCRKKFTQNVLSKFFSPFHIYCWNNKCDISSFKGNHFKEVIFNSKNLSNFIKEKVEKNTGNENLTSKFRSIKVYF